MNRFGFDAASFCEEDARQVQALRKILFCTQVHGAKLGADDVTSIVFLALIWTGHRILGLTIHFLTPILASIAVGTALSSGPPHRSQRAELPHWAPASDSGVEPHVRKGMPLAGGR